MTAVFDRNDRGDWVPGELAQGPFAGLQGGAVAGLMVAEVEAMADAEGLGRVVAVDVGFHRPTPLEPLRTTVTRLHAGRRAAFVESVLRRADGQVCASLRATLLQAAPLALTATASTPGPGAREGAPYPDPLPDPLPDRLPDAPRRAAPHGRPWFMDTMRSRVAPGGTVWFRVDVPVVAGAGAMARALGPADWCHGIRRPTPLGREVAADPNPDLSVRLVRPPRGAWIGVRATTLWHDSGLGVGLGTLCDEQGDIGSVSMSVALVPVGAAAA